MSEIRKRLDEITQNLLPPEYFAAERVSQQAQQRVSTLALPKQVDAELDPIDCGNISDEWLTQTIEYTQATETWDKQRIALLALMRDARNRAQTLRQNAVPKILGALDEELRRLLIEVQTVSDALGDADTAQAAVANDAGPQWKRLAELADDYAELRAAQHQLMSPEIVFSAKADFGEEHASDLYLKNLDDIWPAWRNPDTSNERVVNVNGAQHRSEPWPTDPTELLLWLVRSNAQPWIPNEQQLQRLRSDRAARANPTPKVIHGRTDLVNRPITLKGTA
ncbi:hypothetical protein [Mycobacterium shigaense]|uniref:hypothetical protein n=1 Tax=Mycobacterium shigaense TaxID=722731 RepID=UPI002ADF41B2|nr:hypothetical protein [Mycobacterium shigaense]MEA1123891.1 hypothetical protein [Mycobacterium shigaense]